MLTNERSLASYNAVTNVVSTDKAVRTFAPFVVTLVRAPPPSRPACAADVVRLCRCAASCGPTCPRCGTRGLAHCTLHCRGPASICRTPRVRTHNGCSRRWFRCWARGGGRAAATQRCRPTEAVRIASCTQVSPFATHTYFFAFSYTFTFASQVCKLMVRCWLMLSVSARRQCGELTLSACGAWCCAFCAAGGAARRSLSCVRSVHRADGSPVLDARSWRTSCTRRTPRGGGRSCRPSSLRLPLGPVRRARV